MPTATETSALWERIDALVALAPSPAAAHHHHLGALAARARRRRDLPVEPSWHAAEQAAAMSALAAPLLLRRVRAATSGTLLHIKGAEAAASWARPEARPFKDVDLLTEDVAGTCRALRAAGFEEVTGDWVSVPDHHSRPLLWPGIPLTVEIHDALRPVEGLPAPGLEQLLRVARPSATGVPGVLGLTPSAHAVLLALHAWSHGPLTRLGPLIDVAATLADGDRDEAAALARAWGCRRVWRATVACIDGLLGDGPPSIAVALWARHLRAAREPSVLESHLAEVAAAAWGLAPVEAGPGVVRALRRTALTAGDDTWADKRRRARRAFRHASMPLSDYRTLS